LDLVELLLEHQCLAGTCVNLFEEYLALPDEVLLRAGAPTALVLVGDPVPAMLRDYAAGAHVQLVVLAEVLRLLLGVLQAELLGEILLLRDRGLDLVLMLVQIVYMHTCGLITKWLTQDREILDKLLHVWREVFPAGGAGEDVASAQVHEAVLAEGVPALKDARDLVLVVVVVVANGAGDVHVSALYTQMMKDNFKF